VKEVKKGRSGPGWKSRGGKAPPKGTSISPAASSKSKRVLSQTGKAKISTLRFD